MRILSAEQGDFRHLYNDNEDSSAGEAHDFLFPKRPAFDPQQLMDLIFSFENQSDGNPGDLLHSFCEFCHPDKRHCDPASLIRTGELVENGGFERGLMGWDISGYVNRCTNIMVIWPIRDIKPPHSD